jgi:hypothetical protein
LQITTLANCTLDIMEVVDLLNFISSLLNSSHFPYMHRKEEGLEV